MRRPVAWLLFALVPATFAACNLTVDTDGLSASDDAHDASVIYVEVDGGVVYVQTDGAASSGDDATIPVETADAADAGDADGDAAFVDGGQMDTGLEADADAGPPIADAGPFCPGADAHSMCSDFDENALTFDYTTDGLHWGSNVFGGGAIRLDSDASTSPPASLFSQVFFVDGGTNVSEGAALLTTIPTTTKAVRVEMDVLPSFAAPLAFGQVSLVNLFEIVGTTGYYGTTFGASNEGYYFDNNVLKGDGGTTGTFLDLPALAANVWSHVSITATRLPAGHVRLAYNNQTPVLDQDVSLATATANTLELVVGLNANNAFPTVSAHFDNITVDITP